MMHCYPIFYGENDYLKNFGGGYNGYRYLDLAGPSYWLLPWFRRRSPEGDWYSANKNFRKGVKTITVAKSKAITKIISKLSAGKMYYVRVRSYKSVKVSGKAQKLYGAWSGTKRSKSIKK